jgi:hypothetical protein
MHIRKPLAALTIAAVSVLGTAVSASADDVPRPAYLTESLKGTTGTPRATGTTGEGGGGLQEPVENAGMWLWESTLGQILQ